MASEISIGTELMKVLDRVKTLKPKWHVGGNIGFVAGDEGFNLRYTSPDNLYVYMYTTPIKSYYSSAEHESHLSVSHGNYPNEVDSFSIYSKTFWSPSSSSHRTDFNQPETWNEASCCLYLKKFITEIAKPVIIAEKLDKEAHQQVIRNKFMKD